MANGEIQVIHQEQPNIELIITKGLIFQFYGKYPNIISRFFYKLIFGWKWKKIK